MRVGFNPHKDRQQIPDDYFHQVILPVYIPSFDGYFKESFRILHYCIDSLLLTIHAKTAITIVNNGSCDTVVAYLNDLLDSRKIQELIHTSNIGKMNAVLKGLAGNQYPLVTVADADVMFLHGWQKATYALFENFPNVGAVCPTPSSRSYKTFTSNIFWDYFGSGKLQFTDVINPNGLKAFAHSVGNDQFYNKYQLEKYLTLSEGNERAVVGAGHFLSTYRKEVFGKTLPKHTKYNLGGNSEKDILDIPVVRAGYYRLSTADNYAFHLGNVEEPWMETVFESLQNTPVDELKKPGLKEKKGTLIGYYIKTRLFSKIIFHKKVLRLFFRFKGLPAQMITTYLNN